MREKNLIAYTFLNASEPQFGIDVIVDESLRFKKYLKHSVTVEAWKTPIPVVSIDDLIDMKKSTNRRKDAEDVAALLELKGL